MELIVYFAIELDFLYLGMIMSGRLLPLQKARCHSSIRVKELIKPFIEAVICASSLLNLEKYRLPVQDFSQSKMVVVSVTRFDH